MRMIRKSPEQELERLRGKLADAELELSTFAGVDEEIRSLEEEARQLDVDVFMDDLPREQYDRRRGEIIARRAELQEGRERAEGVAEAVRGRAADLAESMARERVTAAQAVEDERRAELEVAAGVWRQKQSAVDAARAVREQAQLVLRDARVEFDRDAERRKLEREGALRSEARWYASQGREAPPDRPDLAEMIEDVRAAEETRAALAREQLVAQGGYIRLPGDAG